MKKKYKEFMQGSDGESIEELIKKNLDDYDQLRALTNSNIESINDIYDKTFSKIRKMQEKRSIV